MYAPAGLHLGASTPEEIALSVMSQMVALRRGGQRPPHAWEENGLSGRSFDVDAVIRRCEAEDSFGLKPLVILVAVDIQEDSFILHFQPYRPLLVAGEDGTAAYVSLERHDLGKDRAIEQDRVAADTLVRRDDDLRFGVAVPIGELIQGFGANEWLVRQHNEGSTYFRIERREPGLQGTRHSLLVGRVDHNLETLEQRGRKLVADGFCGSAENQNDLTDASRRTFSRVRPSTVLSPRRSSCFASPMRVDLPAAKMMAPTCVSWECRLLVEWLPLALSTLLARTSCSDWRDWWC